MPKKEDIVEKDSLRLYSIPAALVACPKHFFRQASTEIRAAMAMVKDASDILDTREASPYVNRIRLMW